MLERVWEEKDGERCNGVMSSPLERLERAVNRWVEAHPFAAPLRVLHHMNTSKGWAVPDGWAATVQCTNVSDNKVNISCQRTITDTST